MAGTAGRTDDRTMTLRWHEDLGGFADVAMPLLHADPVRHTLALTVLIGQLRLGRGHEVSEMVTVHDGGGAPCGVSMRTAGWPLIVGSLPPVAVPAVATTLAERGVVLPGASGARPQADSFVAEWTARTGQTATVTMAQRLFRLGELVAPSGVPGAARLAGAADAELVADLRVAFWREALPAGRQAVDDPVRQAQRQIAAGHATLLWEHAGEPVATASANPPVAGMSRIGSVWTRPRWRGHGFASAVTAAASRWAVAAGAQHVVLFTDQANPVSNAIYPRIGYRPVLDAMDYSFS